MIESLEPPVAKKEIGPDATAYDMTLVEARKATKGGAIAAFIVAAMTTGFVVFAMATNADGDLGHWADPWALVDVFLVAILGVGVMRNSRAAAVALVVYFALARILIVVETGQVAGLPVSLVLLYWYVKAVQGSFAFHKLHKQADLQALTSGTMERT